MKVKDHARPSAYAIQQCYASRKRPSHARRLAVGNLLAASSTVAILALFLDASVIKMIDANSTPALNDFFEDVSEIADAGFFTAIALCIYGASKIALTQPLAQRWRLLSEHAKSGSLLLLLTLATGGLITLILKHAVARARPSMLLEHGHYGLSTPFVGSPFNSFPSSHAFTAFAVACVLAHLMPRWHTPLLVVAALAGLCRVLTLEHFLSDVLASAFIAIWCTRFWAPRMQDVRFCDSSHDPHPPCINCR